LASYAHSQGKFHMHENESCIFRTKNEWENGLAIVIALLLNLKKKYEINERFVTILEQKFMIKHGRVKRHEKRHTVEFFFKNNSNPSARCVF